MECQPRYQFQVYSFAATFFTETQINSNLKSTLIYILKNMNFYVSEIYISILALTVFFFNLIN